MAHSVIQLTQSRFYSPAFNAAVFDGPIRIYFAQHQEGQALQVYFRLQQYLKESYSTLRKNFKENGQTIFLMLYPNSETFSYSFPKAIENTTAEVAKLGEDFVIGVRGLGDERDYDSVFGMVSTILQEPTRFREPVSPSI